MSAPDRSWDGYFIAFCGIDGSGKTTQLHRVEDLLTQSGSVLCTRQPTDLYRQDSAVRQLLNLEKVDQEIVRELALFSAFDRLRHLRTVVYPRLAVGDAVLTDRYVYSTYSYFMARGVHDLDWLKSINRHAPEPDLVFYLDVPPDVAATRIIARDGASCKREEIDMDRMAAVRSIFLSQPWGKSNRFHVLDGTMPPDVVTKSICEIVTKSDPR